MSKNNQPNANTPDEHRLDFFRHDQITFLVTHAADAIDPQQRDRLADEVLIKWRERIQGLLGPSEWKLKEDQPIRSYSFPAVVGDEFSNPDLKEEFPEDFSLLFIDVKSDKHPANTNEERTNARQSLLGLIASLNEQAQSNDFNPAGFITRGVFPNWVASSSSGASDSGGTGGPGGRPSPYTGDTEEVPFFFDKLITTLKKTEKNGKDVFGDGMYEDGKCVDVIILDTAPSEHDLVRAHKELVLVPQRNSKKGHPLIKSLLGPSGKLKLYPATYEEHIRMGNTSLNKHGYKMTDHGLFIAGIIHSIVPKATIHLIEVLNQFGVGDLETIARGLAQAYSICRKSKRKAVINGSLCLDLPDLKKEHAYRPTSLESILPGDQGLEESLRKEMEKQVDDNKSKPPEDAPFWVLALRVMCERLGKAGRQIVAAAGNDSKKEQNQRKAQSARYPAAFSRVLGVGAIPKHAIPDGNNQYEASSFSNLADNPQQKGIMALGGEEGENNGVLGIYIGEFPPNEAADGSNDGTGWDKGGKKGMTGWAWWAGTSFATPILTGVIASVLTNASIPATTTQRAVEILYDEGVIVQSTTPQQEDGIPSSLEQTFPPLGRWP